MKKVKWQNKFPNRPHLLTQPLQYKIGSTGYATCKDIDVLLKITEKKNNLIYHAIVIGFDPPTLVCPNLEIGDEVEVGIQHFIPD